MSWQIAAREVHEAIESAIPPKWRLDPKYKEHTENVIDIPATCGLLSSDDLRITESDAATLVDMLASGKLSAIRVTEAFCGRAAIAHQLVRQFCREGKKKWTGP